MKLFELYIENRTLSETACDNIDKNQLINEISLAFNELTYFMAEDFMFCLIEKWKNNNPSFFQRVLKNSSESMIGVMNSCRFFGTYMKSIPINKGELNNLKESDSEKFEWINKMLKSSGMYHFNEKREIKTLENNNVRLDDILTLRKKFLNADFIKIDDSPPEKIEL